MCVCLLFLASLFPFRIAQAGAPDPGNPGMWKYQVLSASMTGVTSNVIDVAGAANGLPTSGKTVMLRSWCALTVGNSQDALLTLAITTGTYSALAAQTTSYNNPSASYYYTAPTISTSTVFLPAGVSVCDEPTEYPTNPIFTFSALNPAATAYLWVEYGKPR